MWRPDEMVRPPVLALDLDGVLNALDPPAGAGWERHDIHVPASTLPDSPFIRGHGTEDVDVTIHLHPRHGPWIRSLLAGGVEVVWITTWEHAANAHIAPLLGIPPLPVVSLTPTRLSYVLSLDTASAKLDRLDDQFGDRCLVWIDDLATRSVLRDGRWVQIRTDARRGLTEYEQATAENHLAWARTAQPEDLFQLDFTLNTLSVESAWSLTTADQHRVMVTRAEWDHDREVLNLHAVWEPPAGPPRTVDADCPSSARGVLSVGNQLVIDIEGIAGPQHWVLGAITRIWRCGHRQDTAGGER
jgi:hypothetical protein